jgi:molybdenum-dependent DNA-binding transcriptional regulator ModE
MNSTGGAEGTEVDQSLMAEIKKLEDAAKSFQQEVTSNFQRNNHHTFDRANMWRR